MLVFGIGYYFETVADGQLQAFKADPNNKGRYLRTGVWTHTRHPNYFGNATVWWGIFFTTVAGNPALWWTIIGPVINTIMLTGILGRAFQDKFMGSRPAYQKVMAETNGFLPFPKARR
jgi:steroid 5-alpha reductase family enzyme